MDKELKHHGILGMKWGVRREPGKGGRAPVSKAKPQSSKPRSEEHKTSRAILREPTPTLSNAQLKSVVDRINLEQQYAKLTKPKTPVKDFVKDVLYNSGKTIATKLVTKIGIQALEGAMGIELSDKKKKAS